MEYPEGSVPILPIKNCVLFPHILMPMVVNRSASLAALDEALLSEDKFIALFTQKDAHKNNPSLDDLYEVGTLGVIKKMVRLEQALHIDVQGIVRIKRKHMIQQKNYLNDSFYYLPELEKAQDSVQSEALYRTIMELVKKMINLLQPEMQMGLNIFLADIDNPIKQIYLLTTILSLDVEKEIELLSVSSEIKLLTLMHEHLEHEVQVLELRDQINKQTQSKVGQEQREYFLRQQLRTIQEELGEERPEQADVTELRKKLCEAGLPETAQGIVEKELNRLERMSSASSDYQLTRTYIEFILDMPWQSASEDRLDLEYAEKVLNEDHFDLKEVKERILEHLAVMKLNPSGKAPVLCLVGPPGVGKTSIGKSVARSMGRKFERISLGGLHDEAELRGHRRTYVGAMPGQVLQALRRVGVHNPVLMLDELDKLGHDFRGDPAAALMEVLDPAQNTEFHDNYLDIPFDLSNVFFIATANTLQNIPLPLLDRMEVLRLAGYSDQEKLEIARRYIVPRQVKEVGLDEQQLILSDEIINDLIQRYTREAGVRGLERVIGSVARKIATRVVKGEIGPFTISTEYLTQLLGPEIFHMEKVRRKPSAGVVAGLAWTEAGGDVLYVESVCLTESKDLMLTGQLGDVMQESAKTARSYIIAHAQELGIDRNRLSANGVHIHVPAGAVPKDGPSAGVTMLTALASVYSGIPVRDDTAMTGEITLSGLVLPVGGIKEKVLAAHRCGIHRIILPFDNKKDLTQIPEQVYKTTEFICVRHIDELLEAALSHVE